MSWSPSKAREAVVALALVREIDGAGDEAKKLRAYARAGAFKHAEDVRVQVRAVAGPHRADALAKEIA